MGLLLPFLSVLLGASAALFIIWHLWLRYQLKDVNQPRSYPVIGHAMIMKPDPQGLINQILGMSLLYPRHPRQVLFWLGPIPMLMLYSAKMVEPILASGKHLNKSISYKLLEPWLGLSLLTSPAQRWRVKRKMLTPTFHYDILRDFVQVFNEQSEILIRKLHKVANSPSRIFEVQEIITLCTLDIICETSMGRSVDAQLEEDNEYVRAVHSINLCVQNRMKNPIMWSDFMFSTFGEGKEHDKYLNVLHSFTRQVIAERAEELKANHWRLEGRRAFLDLLLEMAHKGEMSMDDIQAEVDTFMFEGHDTTSAGLTWAIHLIGNHPEVQQKIQAELDEILGDRRYVTTEDISKMKYLECCLKESLRICPSVPFIMRELGSPQELGETMFPKGTMVLLNINEVHRDPENWENPDEFIPERFLPENSVGRHPFAFIPFSAGSRNCIGQRFALMEEKVIMAYILRNFNIKSLHARHQTRTKVELILRPTDGVFVRLELRSPR